MGGHQDHGGMQIREGHIQKIWIVTGLRLSKLDETDDKRNFTTFIDQLSVRI
jgi:hypothetical protein